MIFKFILEQDPCFIENLYQFTKHLFVWKNWDGYNFSLIY